MLQALPQADGSTLLVPGIVPKLLRTPGGQRSAAPALGQDSDAVLAGMGLSAAQIVELKARGIVQGG
jgi:formyl-CoA transferase